MGRYELPDDGGSVEIIAGEFNGVKGAATTFSPVHLYNVKPKKGTTLAINLPENYTTAMVVIEGQAKINKIETAPVNNFILFKNDGAEILIEAEEDNARKDENSSPKYGNADNNGLTLTYQKFSTAYLYLNFPKAFVNLSNFKHFGSRCGLLIQ